MKTWKLVSGILSMLFTVIILFQSCAASLVISFSESSDSGDFAGFLVAILILAGGIVSIATRSQTTRGGNMAIMIIYILAYLLCTTNAKVYKDLEVWGGWCVICAVVATISLIINDRKNKKAPSD